MQKEKWNTEQFISCDWGTSTFRLRWVQMPDVNILAKVKTSEGISQAYRQWQERGSNVEDRLPFYQRYLLDGIRQMKQQTSNSLENLTVVISGMASSSIGMMELPYSTLPFSCSGEGLNIKKIPPSCTFPHPMLIISGARAEDDVMRGEETKIVGAYVRRTAAEDEWMIMPGTHPKHIHISRDRVINFKTYMTGELFHLLSAKSILSASVQATDAPPSAHFIKGVKEASQANLLHKLFKVRTAALFSHYTPAESYHYLSGLLIGSELLDLQTQHIKRVSLIASGQLAAYYQAALENLDIQITNCIDADEALLRGQQQIFALQGG
ncbi:MAG: 2-dehydro-3-deoxygalactonokinase [Williamsia sp.]|nr:2-dehydro-3-deoxygalactonokinase [Williamsia sp.]